MPKLSSLIFQLPKLVQIKCSVKLANHTLTKLANIQHLLQWQIKGENYFTCRPKSDVLSGVAFDSGGKICRRFVAEGEHVHQAQVWTRTTGWFFWLRITCLKFNKKLLRGKDIVILFNWFNNTSLLFQIVLQFCKLFTSEALNVPRRPSTN